MIFQSQSKNVESGAGLVWFGFGFGFSFAKLDIRNLSFLFLVGFVDIGLQIIIGL
jgi:hypothetical protein